MAKSRISKLIQPYVITKGRKFRLKDIDPGDTGGIKADKAGAEAALAEGVARLRKLQEKLYAQNNWGVLLIFQALDAAGKGGAVEHVMSGVDPAGVEVCSFKAPSPEERDHDFMWRSFKRLPERGRIGIFDRSYYEEVLIVRVHSEILAGAPIPSPLVTKHIWKERFEDIRAFERYFARQGYVIRKFFLHITQKEQLKRLRKRLDEPEKNWKFNLGDLKERARWNDYMKAYEDLIQNTASPEAPWVVVPGNKKWFARIVVAATIIDALEKLDLKFPKLDGTKRRELEEGRQQLEQAIGGKSGDDKKKEDRKGGKNNGKGKRAKKAKTGKKA
jgi:PPK2 family polyphosphate:nucleotide phosphotransferase